MRYMDLVVAQTKVYSRRTFHLGAKTRSLLKHKEAPLIHHSIRDLHTQRTGTMTQNTNSTRILYVGGSFGCIASLYEFIRLFKEANVPTTTQVEAFIIEPRAGFINLLAIPRAVIDPEFAKKTYMNAEKFDYNFTSVETTSKEFEESFKNENVKEMLPENLKVHFIQGRATAFIDNHSVFYQLEGSQETKKLSFDYCLFATGRSRRWPFDPVATTESQYIEEMGKSKTQVEDAKIVTVIGGGALGIEIAGEIKETYPEKRVVLVHPHPFVPPEKYSTKNFNELLQKNIAEMGVEMEFSTRIEKELENGDLLTTDGRTLESDLNMWCNYHKNNIEPLLPVFEDAIDKSASEVIVDDRFMIKGQENMFSVGDVTNLPIIKTCGAAWHYGQRVARSMFNIIVRGEEVYDRLDMENLTHSMTIVVGCHRIVSQWDSIGDGKVVFNNEYSVNYYADYGCADIREQLDIAP